MTRLAPTLALLLCAACATVAPLDAASDAYTALYTLRARAVTTDADLAALDKMESCWATLHTWARTALDAHEPEGAVLAVLAAYLGDVDGTRDCGAAP